MAQREQLKIIPYDVVTLEKFYLSAQAAVSDRMIQESVVQAEQVRDRLVYQVRSSLLGRMIVDKHVRWPANWREALKERWAPAFWLEKHPVRYERFDYTLIDALAERIAVPGRSMSFVVLNDFESLK